MSKHQLAEYVRILARGKRASRHYTTEEARHVMTSFLDDTYEPEQLGAIFMLLRVMGEEADELAGFAQAINQLWPHQAQNYDIVLASYAGKRRQPMWNMLAALLLSQMGYRILVHGCESHTEGRTYATDVFDFFDWSRINSDSDWEKYDDGAPRLVYLPCRQLHANLQHWLGLKSILGVRSPINTVLKTIAPKNVLSLQGIFHPVYSQLHSEAEMINGGSMMVVKGEGGEFEINPERTAKITRCRNGDLLSQLVIENTQSVFLDKPEGHSPAILEQAWCGDIQSEYIDRAVIDTAAAALTGLLPNDNWDSVREVISNQWKNRDRGRL